MNKLVRFYNQNRHMFWVVILSIIAIIVIIQVLNKFAYEKTNSNNAIGEQGKNTSSINNNYSVVTGKEINTEKKQVIDKFILYCNNKQIEEAYELLSDECKENLYPTLNNFTTNYYDKIFSEKKSYACQAWITEDDFWTYRIDFVQDMLATGEPSKTSILDYYTVVKDDNNEYKLNINKFVGIEGINKAGTSNNVTLNILRKKIYMDYEIYDIEVTNKTQGIIMLDDMQSTKNIYLEDDNENEYFWYSHEIIENDITIRSSTKQEISIKFNKEYKPNNDVVKIVFSNIISNEKSINIIVDI